MGRPPREQDCRGDVCQNCGYRHEPIVSRTRSSSHPQRAPQPVGEYGAEYRRARTRFGCYLTRVAAAWQARGVVWRWQLRDSTRDHEAFSG
jgi:hypothetical protein